MRAGLLQPFVSDDANANPSITLSPVAKAADRGAEFVLTPEVTNCVSASRSRQRSVLAHEAQDETLAGLRDAARQHGVWLLVGSLALKSGDADGRFANRSFMIRPDGGVVARYDKIHMFDVEVSETETYRESAGFRPGNKAGLVETPFGGLRMSVCYDLRCPHLYRALAKAGAKILSVPAAAFSSVTGSAH